MFTSTVVCPFTVALMDGPLQVRVITFHSPSGLPAETSASFASYREPRTCFPLYRPGDAIWISNPPCTGLRGSVRKNSPLLAFSEVLYSRTTAKSPNFSLVQIMPPGVWDGVNSPSAKTQFLL